MCEFIHILQPVRLSMAPTKKMQNQLLEEVILSYNVANANENPKNVSENQFLSAGNSIDKDKMDIIIKSW